MFRNIGLWGIFFLLGAFNIQAQTLEYIENKGQWHHDVHFKAQLSAGALFLRPDGYRVLQYHTEDYGQALRHASGHDFSNHAVNPAQSGMHEVSIRSHAYDVGFANANPKAVASTERQMPGYNNYFLGTDTSKWAGGVYGFGVVRYHEIYKGVDVRYYSDNGFVKYDLLLTPGAAVQDIALEYKGATALRLVKGALFITTSAGEIQEQAPYAYQLIEGVRNEIKCNYVLSGTTVRFRMPDYNPAYPLVIDPTLIFSTFAGSTPDNWGYTATFDVEGNAYGGGIVFGTGYPVSTGAFQTRFGGGVGTVEGSTGFDISIVKLDPLGQSRIYATYLGGNSNEQPHSLIVDKDGNLVMAGRTLSTNFPLAGAGLIGPGGSWDMVITKFNPGATSIIGSVRIGGTAVDGANDRHKFPNPTPNATNQNYGDDARSEVQLDEQGNIYVASNTQSPDFPVTPNNVQGSLSGTQDALILKFNPTLTNLELATYLGGTGYDAAYVLIVEPSGDILVAGGTMSADFPGFKSGTVGPNFEGGALDGFMARLGSSGNALLEVAFIGTTGNDQLYGIQRDRNGFIYVMGTSTGNFPVRNALFSQSGGKQFIAKMQPDLSAYVYSTVFGTNTANPNLSPTAFLVDNCENVYVSGWGGNIIDGAPYPIAPTTGLAVTPDAIQTATDGRDFYFFVLEKDAVRQLYGSFFGQQDGASNPNSHDHVDGGTSRFDQNGIIYQGMCANCNGGQFPTTPGTVSPNNPSTRCNLAVVKINFNLSGVRTGIQSFVDGIRRDSSYCVPATIEFVDSIAIGKRFEWSFGDGSPSIATDTPRAIHTFANEGVYRVQLIAIDDEKCIPRDTAIMNIRVRIDRVPLNARGSLLPPCESLNYRFENLSTPFPGKPFKDSSFVWIFGDNSAPLRSGLAPVTHRYAGAGTYNVQLILADTNYCNAPDTFRFQVQINPLVTSRIEAPLTGCAPFTINFRNTSVGGTTFDWDFGNGQTSNLAAPVMIYPLPGQYRIRLVANDPNTCNRTDTSYFNLFVSGSPNAAFTYNPIPSQENIPTNFTNLSGPAVLYRWDFGDSNTLVTIRRDTLVRHQYPRTETFNTCLIAINEFGCADTTCLPVPARVNPLIDVVSAFTPNNDGVNDRAMVYGFGVVKMTFRIYNRWGQLMFESSDPRQGWDGMFKGKPQPMEAYAYTLDADLINGERVKRGGSITLVR
jgi:gliding motility-associated-like protein